MTGGEGEGLTVGCDRAAVAGNFSTARCDMAAVAGSFSTVDTSCSGKVPGTVDGKPVDTSPSWLAAAGEDRGEFCRQSLWWTVDGNRSREDRGEFRRQSMWWTVDGNRPGKTVDSYPG